MMRNARLIAVCLLLMAALPGAALAMKEYKGWKAEVEQKLAAGDFTAAMTQLKSIEAAGTELDSDYYFLLGKAQSSMGNTDKAIELMDKALGMEPTFTQALGHKSLLLLQKGRPAEAEAAATKAIGMEASGELYYARGAIRMTQNRFEDAIADLTSAIGMEPKNEEYYIARGEVRLRVGRPNEAKNDYAKAIELNPENPKAYLGRGGVAILGGQYAEARIDLDKCVALAPKFASCYIRRGKLFQLAGELDRSIADFTKGVEYAPQSDEAWFERTMTELQDGKAAAAESSARNLLKIRDDARSRKVLGMVLTSLNRYDEAVQEFTKAIAGEPKDFESLYLRGNVYALKNNMDKALVDFDAAIVIEKRYLDPYVAKANVMVARKDWQAALTVCNEALAVAPKNPNLYQMRSQIYEALGQYDKSMEDFKAAKSLAAEFRDKQ